MDNSIGAVPSNAGVPIEPPTPASSDGDATTAGANNSSSRTLIDLPGPGAATADVGSIAEAPPDQNGVPLSDDDDTAANPSSVNASEDSSPRNDLSLPSLIDEGVTGNDDRGEDFSIDLEPIDFDNGIDFPETDFRDLFDFEFGPPAGGTPPADPPFEVTGATMDQAIGWVQTMLAIPIDSNPVLDETGEFAELGDVGDVHYLANSFGSATERSFDVDFGDTLVAPLLNVWSDEFTNNLPDLREDVLAFAEAIEIGTIRLQVDLFDDGTVDFELGDTGEIDVSGATYYPEVGFPEGLEEAERFFVEPEAGDEFTIEYPERNIAGYPDGPGTTASYTTGYYAQLNNLPSGTHELVFGGSAADGDFDVLVTDFITVGEPDDFALL